MPEQTFEVGDRVLYTRYAKPNPGTITRVNVTHSDDPPGAIAFRSYDIQLDAGGNLLEIRDHLERLNPK